MFFTQINQMMSQGVDITLVIRKKEGQLTVCSMPKVNGMNDEAQNHIIPLTLTGTPEELDNAFLQTICQPIQRVSGLLSNMKQFEKQAQKAAENAKATKELKDKQTKEAKEKKERFDKLMKAAGELETAQKYSDAIATLQHAKTFANEQSLKMVEEKVATLKGKMSQGSLFEMEPNPQPVQTPIVNQPQGNVQPQANPQEPVQNPQPAQQTQPAQQHLQNGPIVQEVVQQAAPTESMAQNPAVQPIQTATVIQETVQQPMQQTADAQPVQPSLQENPIHNPAVQGQPAQQPFQNPTNGNIPVQNGQLFSGQQQPVNNNTPVNNNGQQENNPQMMDFNPAHAYSMPVDYSAHREGEYDQYPDFPNHSNDHKFNF